MEEQKIELKIINMADIQSQEIEWLWYPFILWEIDNYSRRSGEMEKQHLY